MLGSLPKPLLPKQVPQALDVRFHLKNHLVLKAGRPKPYSDKAKNVTKNFYLQQRILSL